MAFVVGQVDFPLTCPDGQAEILEKHINIYQHLQVNFHLDKLNMGNLDQMGMWK